MRVFKHKKTGEKFETDNDNLVSMLEREGYEEVEGEVDTELEELRAKAKELGLKGYNNMKKETLLAKIAEAESN